MRCNELLTYRVGKAKIHAGVAIQLFRRRKIKLVNWDLAMPLVPDGDCVPAQDEVAHLLRRTSVFKNQSDRRASGLSA